MESVDVYILGTKWKIMQGSESEFPGLAGADGYTDTTAKEIVVDDMQVYSGHDDSKKNMDEYQKLVLRHEIIHAFMEESGLSGNFEHKPIGVDETMVDWVAIQFPKIFKVFNELDLI